MPTLDLRKSTASHSDFPDFSLPAGREPIYELDTLPVADNQALDAEIAAEAYLLYEARGLEHGHDVEDWILAEAIVRQRHLRD